MGDTVPGRSPRRDPVHEERLEILNLLGAGEITADEAATLLDALDRSAPRGNGNDPPSVASGDGTDPVGGRARQVRIRVSDGATGRTTVNLALPLGLIDAGLGIARRLAPERVADAEAIRESIATGFRGSLLDVHDSEERVEIIIE